MKILKGVIHNDVRKGVLWPVLGIVRNIKFCSFWIDVSFLMLDW